MKTVIDAVNALNGDLEFANQGDSGYPYLLVDIHNGSYWLSGMGKSAVESGKLYNYICTVGEFNACVAELSAATWIDGISLEEWKVGMKSTVIDSHGNELVDGKAYQFDLSGTKKVGVWHDDIGSFFDGFDGPISEICTRSEATRIIPLVPEVK